MPRWLIILHRYTGVVMGLLMTLWCLSGVVMMYVGYPELSDAQRLKALSPIDWARCCDAAGAGREDADPVDGFRIESLGQTPVLRLSLGMGRVRTVDLTTGRAIEAIDPAQAKTLAAGLGERLGIGAPARVETIDTDQWTVSGEYSRHRPLYRAAFADRGGTTLYLSSVTGELVQETTRAQRAWNWLGAVPHWLYPTLLRQNAPLWSQVVIWTSVVGTFLTLTGLYLGLVQLARKHRTGRWSPYKGLFFWHHVSGLVFGLLTLAWVFSGLMSMNPWGLLEGGGSPARAQVSGDPPTWSQVKETLAALKTRPPAGAVSLSAASMGGDLNLLSYSADAKMLRLNAQALPSRVTLRDLHDAAEWVSEGLGMRTQALLTDEDDYYFAHHGSVTLPVYRIILADPDRTRVYIDTETGRVVRTVDADGRGYRWWHLALHRWDFAAPLRARPVWDLVMLLLLAGVTLSVGLGTWMGLRRLVQDLRPRRAASQPADDRG